MENCQKLLSSCNEEEIKSVIKNGLNGAYEQIINQVTKRYNLRAKEIIPILVLGDNPKYYARTICNKIEISLPLIWLYSDFLLLFINWIPISEDKNNYFIHPVVNFEDTSHYLKSIISSIRTGNLGEHLNNRPFTLEKFLKLHESQRKQCCEIFYYTESYIIAHELGHWLQDTIINFKEYYQYKLIKDQIIIENIKIEEHIADLWAKEILSDIFALDILLEINFNKEYSDSILSFIPLIIIDEERKKTQNKPINFLDEDHPPSLMRINLVRRYARALLNIIDDYGQRIEQIAFYLYSYNPDELKEFYLNHFNITDDLDLDY